MLTLGILFGGSTCLAVTASIYATPFNGGDTADTFVTSGSANGAASNKNFGAAGTLVVAGSASGNGEFDSLIKFTLAGAKAQFDSQLGAGNWTIADVTLTLATNFGIQGAQPNNAIFSLINTGSFAISWLDNNSWVEGSAGGGSGAVSNGTTQGITFNSKTSYLDTADETLGSFTYTPPGNNTGTPLTYDLGLTSGFVADITSGGDATLYLTPGNATVCFLFNARSYASNHPILTVTANEVPEPSSCALLLGGAGTLVLLMCKRTIRSYLAD